MNRSSPLSAPFRRRNAILAGVGGLIHWAEVAAQAGTSPRVRMPTLFIGHGSPMNALRRNAFTADLNGWGRALPRPLAVLVVSAHWLTPGKSVIQTQAQAQTIDDFQGFPKALHEFEYPAPGSPATAPQAQALVSPSIRLQAADDWGLDHGTWSVLTHLYPKADVPVLQLSIDYAQEGAFHLGLGQALAGLRDLGVLIVGSGNLVHNLRRTERAAPDDAPQATQDWSAQFDAAAWGALQAGDTQALARPERLAGAEVLRLAHPTPDHYWPLLYPLGAAAGSKAVTRHLSFQAGTLSMRCVQFG